MTVDRGRLRSCELKLIEPEFIMLEFSDCLINGVTGIGLVQYIIKSLIFGFQSCVKSVTRFISNV